MRIWGEVIGHWVWYDRECNWMKCDSHHGHLTLTFYWIWPGCSVRRGWQGFVEIFKGIWNFICCLGTTWDNSRNGQIPWHAHQIQIEYFCSCLCKMQNMQKISSFDTIYVSHVLSWISNDYSVADWKTYIHCTNFYIIGRSVLLQWNN